MIKRISVLFLSVMFAGLSLYAQPDTSNSQLRNAVAGQKYKIKGVVVAKENDNTFIVRDTVGVDTRIVVEPSASVKSNGGFFGGGDKFATNALVRGLNLEVEGRGDSSG